MPTVELDIPRAAGWARLVDFLAALAVGMLAIWWFSPSPDLSPSGRWFILMLGLGATLLGWSSRHSHPCRLRWDGQQWWLAELVDAGEATFTAGRLRVVADLQFAMLLRFDPAAGVIPSSARWLAVERSGQIPDWHLLRCALVRQARGEPSATPSPFLEARG